MFNGVEASFPFTVEQLQNVSCKTPISTLFPKGFLGLGNQKLKETELLPYPQPQSKALLTAGSSAEPGQCLCTSPGGAKGDKQFYLTQK